MNQLEDKMMMQVEEKLLIIFQRQFGFDSFKEGERDIQQ